MLPSPDPHCHHQINFVKMNLKCTVPDPRVGYVWHYGRADEDSLQRCLYQYDWPAMMFKHPNEQVEIMSDRIMNAARNFILGEKKRFTQTT